MSDMNNLPNSSDLDKLSNSQPYTPNDEIKEVALWDFCRAISLIPEETALIICLKPQSRKISVNQKLSG